MADKAKTPAKNDKKPRQLKKTETVRQRAEKASVEKKPRRIKAAGATAARPFKAARRIGQKEYHPIKLPDNKVGRFMSKRRHLFPRYFINSWREVKMVEWPNRRDTTKFTIAVFVFAIFFAALITLADFGLDKVVKQVILK